MASGRFSRDKGKRAEREVVKLLQPVVTRAFIDAYREAPELERNLMQSNKGGCDIAGLEWLALEVKHHETVKLAEFWQQTKDQATAEQIPVLFYKSNRTKWRVMMFGHLPAHHLRVRCPVDISLDHFLIWFDTKLRCELEIIDNK